MTDARAVVLALPGTTTIAKTGKVISKTIDTGTVQAVVSTGALLAHGMSEAVTPLSRCSYLEGVSWGKFVAPPEGARFAGVHADATTGRPLLVKGALEEPGLS